MNNDESYMKQTKKSLRDLRNMLFNIDKNSGRHIGFTKPLLEDRVYKNRKKEKNRRKVLMLQRKAK